MMKEKNTLAQKIFVILAVVMLILPAVFSDKKGGKASGEENRYLAEFPSEVSEELPQQLETWISDNAGGREQALQLYNWFNVRVLQSVRDQSYYYNGDWVFLNNNKMKIDVQKLPVMEGLMEGAFVSLYDITVQNLTDQGIALHTVIFPYKCEVYAEMIPDLYPVRETSEHDFLQRLSAEHPDWNLFDLTPEIMERKANGEFLYYAAYDPSHWNNRGAFVGYWALMGQLAKSVPELKRLEPEDFDLSETYLERKYAGKTYAETDLAYELLSPTAVENEDWFADNGLIPEDEYKSYRYYQTPDTSKPSLIIVGDSYVWMYMMPWIAESCYETVFLNYVDAKLLPAVIQTMDPDAVVFAGLYSNVEAAILDYGDYILTSSQSMS